MDTRLDDIESINFPCPHRWWAATRRTAFIQLLHLVQSRYPSHFATGLDQVRPGRFSRFHLNRATALPAALNVFDPIQSGTRSCSPWAIFLSVFVVASSPAYSAGEHQYLAEGNLLISRLTEVLVQEGVCESAAKCAISDGGHAFVKPVKDGLEISVYGVRRGEVASRLMQESVGSFAMRDFGRHLLVRIFELPRTVTLTQRFGEQGPSFSLKVEK